MDLTHTRNCDRTTCKDCKVIPREAMTTKHRLVALQIRHVYGARRDTKNLMVALQGANQIAFHEELWLQESLWWNDEVQSVTRTKRSVVESYQKQRIIKPLKNIRDKLRLLIKLERSPGWLAQNVKRVYFSESKVI